jgi:hypothetical protein
LQPLLYLTKASVADVAQEESAAGAQQAAQGDGRRKGQAGAGGGDGDEVVCAREHEIRCRSAVVNLKRQCEELELQLRCVYADTCYYICVSSILLYISVCPHTTISGGLYNYTCVSGARTRRARRLSEAIYVSSYYYRCVLILLYLCVLILVYMCLRRANEAREEAVKVALEYKEVSTQTHTHTHTHTHTYTHTHTHRERERERRLSKRL